MTDRSVRVILTAQTGQYQRAMATAGASTKAIASEVKKTSTSAKADLTKVGTTATVTGAALFGGFLLAERATMGFDKQLSALSAVSGATAGEMEKLRQAALDAGQATVFSASEAADAETELAKVGISTADILGGALTGSLNLAAAGGLDLAQAATIAGQSMKIFKLQGSDVTHVADLLAAGANKSAADVGQLGDALRMGGLVAAQTGLSIEETTAALAVFADNALIGSDAGTSLKTMLLALNPKSDEAAALMDRLGFSAYDAQGQFIGLEGLAGQLQHAFSGMTDEQRNAAMMTIFGTDAIRAANVLYKEGASGVREYETAVNDSGAASRMAAEMTDNLAGDLERLKGTLETALIGTGEESNGVLREMVQDLDSVVGGYNSLPGPVKGAAGGFAAVAGATLLVGGALAIVIPRVVETRAALRTLNTEMPRTAAGLKGIGKAGLGLIVLYGAAAAIDAVIGSAEDLTLTSEETKGALIDLSQTDIDAVFKDTYGIDGYTAALRKLSEPSLKNQLDDVAGSVLGVFGIGEGGGRFERQAIVKDFQQLDDALAGLVSSGDGDKAAAAMTELESQAAAAGLSVDELRKNLPKYSDALAGAANQTQLAEEDTAGWASSLEDSSDATGEVTENVKSLQDAMDELNGVTLTQREAQRGYQAALDDAGKALKDNGKGLDIHTRKGRENADALDAIAKAAEDELVALDASGESAKRVGKRHDTMRADLVKAGTRFGLTKKEAERYADAVLAIPTHVSTTAEFHILADIAEIGRHARDEHALHPAAGGWISGPGSGTSDSIPAMVSDGEYVVRASQARKHGALLEAINSGATVTPVGTGSSSTSTFAPVFQIDARGSTMSRAEFEEIAGHVVNEYAAELDRERRAS